MEDDLLDEGGKADEEEDTSETRTRKKEDRKEAGDRVMGEILLKVMNVSLSFLLCDPGAFANYPDSQKVWSLSPPHWGEPLVPVPNAGLVIRLARDSGFDWRSSLLR